MAHSTRWFVAHSLSHFRPLVAFGLAFAVAGPALAQPYATQPVPTDKFRQLEELLPTPTAERTASGAPGRAYWQSRADYVIDAELDDTTQTITGRATITYTNHSPDALAYLWLQLDANFFAHDAASRTADPAPDFKKFGYRQLEGLLEEERYSSDLKILSVTATPPPEGTSSPPPAAPARGTSAAPTATSSSPAASPSPSGPAAAGVALPHTIVGTMMRLDLPQPLPSGAVTSFTVTWSYHINDAKKLSNRSGYEFFPADGNYLYEIAQWYPRLAAYGDVTGWQHKQYLGRGEFTLDFGDYLVRLTVPADHVLAATGTLENADAVLTPAQRERLTAAVTAEKPVFIVTPDEAKAAQADGAAKTAAASRGPKKTWIYRAENVRDFAFASSRKFIWDAWGARGHTYPPTPPRPGEITDLMHRPPVLAMSLYPIEAEPLWSKYSTHSIVHTLDVYSAHTFPYPYPTAISVNGPIGGMEYPMICFNGPRPETDGTYTARTKYGLISVIIHEVGHNYFPMIVNTDERQWTWMDEGMNTFLQYLAEQTWEKDYPSRRGEPRDIIAYMTGPNQLPIMTNSESIELLGPNAYAKPATAFNILRETVLGREAFDHAFKTYAQRWMFKRPYPADFFRTMEDASGIDLDWFWRGWFYTNDYVDVSLDAVRLYTLESRDPAVDKPREEAEKDARPTTLSAQRNAPLPKRTDRYPELLDFYNSYDEATTLPSEKKKYQSLLEELAKEQIDPALLQTDRRFYALEFSNRGGLVTPLILKLTYADGTTEERRIPAEIWRTDSAKVTKLLMTTRELTAIVLDPHEETADADVENNFWPRRAIKSRFQLFKEEKAKNPMRELQEAAKEPAPDAAAAAPAAPTAEKPTSSATPPAP